MFNKKKFFIFFGVTTLPFFLIFFLIMCCALMLFNFFRIEYISDDELVVDNYQVAEKYKKALNDYLKDGYVPLARIMKFYNEDSSLDFNFLYRINQNIETKKMKPMVDVCMEQQVSSMDCCKNINSFDNEITDGLFNSPIKDDFSTTSFFAERRKIFEKWDTHYAWDLAVPLKTPVYSVCNGIVEEANFNPVTNSLYNEIGNYIDIRCDDYDNSYLVSYRHLYQESGKVKKGDKIYHWTQLALAGTTGNSTGPHLHYQVYELDKNGKRGNSVDGMKFINFKM